jgi:hypothetical protein
MYKWFIPYGIILLTILIVGCVPSDEVNDTVMAEVGAKKLYLSEVSAVIPYDLNPADSAVMADDYIRKWIRQELMLQKAEENLPAELKNVDRELEEYRNSLIIFRYKNELMAQRMNTTVSDAETMEYYLQNAENFKLNQIIVKAVSVKIPVDFANPDNLKKLCNDTTEEGIASFKEYCTQYAKSFDILTDRWVELDRIMNNFPTTIEKPEEYLKRNQFIEFSDQNLYHLVAIHDYLLKNEQAPEDYVRENIKSLILNRRKIEFLRDLENNIYQEGVNKNIFKIYNLEKNENE